MLEYGIFRLLGYFFVCTLVVTATFAQESAPITTEGLVKRSRKIVIGEVIEQHSTWDDLGREIYTYTSLRVEEAIKSEAQDSVIVLRHLGGKVGKYTSHVSGLPRFEKGERVLVFLGPYRGTEYYGLIDWQQGKYSIVKKETSEVLIGTGPGRGQTVTAFVSELRRWQ